MLRSVRTVIVDEIHALARDKRGSHLSLVARAARPACAARRRCGSACRRRSGRSTRSPGFWSARPMSAAMASARCHIVDTGHVRELDLAIEVPPSELSAVCSIETWEEVYARLSRTDPRASQHAGVRQHAPAGRARVPLLGRAARRRARGQPSRQPVARDAAAGRRATQERAS